MKRRLSGWRLGALAAFVLVGVAAIGISAAQSAPSKAKRAAASVLIDGTTDSVVNIDPAGSYDFGSKLIQDQIFQHLLESGPGGLVPHPVLATSCSFKGGLTIYACTLRKGVKFHDGSEMTSADVKWSFDRVVKIKDPSGVYQLLSNLQSVSVAGKYGVVFHLKTPEATWPNFLTTTAARIVPKSLYAADKVRGNTESQIGTGPYMLEKYTPGQQAVLKKFDGYWGKPAKIDTVIVRYYSKSSTMKLALQRGDIDMAYRSFTPTEYAALQKAKGLVVLYNGHSAEIRYLVLNTKIPPTDNPAVRKALAYLMPRQTIASRVYHGLVRPLYSMIPVGLPGHIDAFSQLYGPSPDVAKAKATLANAGVSTPVDLTLWYTPTHYGDSSADEFAEIQRALQASGLFKVTLKSAEWATYSKTLGTQYGAFQLGWFPDYVDPENYLLPFYQTSSNFVSNNYSNATMDALLKKEQGTKSLPARLALVKKAQVIAAQDAPIIPYFQAGNIAVAKSNVHGLPTTLDPTLYMRFWLLSKS
jgi:peptide/nickel transport system substrate-binding protein